jgi:hypothetical protein
MLLNFLLSGLFDKTSFWPALSEPHSGSVQSYQYHQHTSLEYTVGSTFLIFRPGVAGPSVGTRRRLKGLHPS